MAGINKKPIGLTPEMSAYYEKTPKHVLMAMLWDYAVATVGEQEAHDDSSLALKEIEEREQILRKNGLIP